MNLDRPVAPDPYSLLPQVPAMAVSSADFIDGNALPDAQVFNDWGFTGGNTSPQLTWSDAPEGTKGFAVTCFDPDAPTVSGFWHWAVVDLPASTTRLAAGAGDQAGSGLPAGALQLRNDAGLTGFLGAAPPPGHGRHRYMFAVIAVDVDRLDLDPGTTPAVLMFNLFGHTLGRALLTGWYER